MNVMKVARTMQGLSQVEMAKKVGCSLPALQKWELKKQTPTLEWAVKIANAYAISMNDLVEHFELIK